jgi:hypothetical protein
MDTPNDNTAAKGLRGWWLPAVAALSGGLPAWRGACY